MSGSSAPASELGATTLPTQVHLLTCVHGMWGAPVHLERLSEIMVETYEQRRAEIKGKGKSDGSAAGQEEDIDVELNVLIAESNRESHTYDGVDWGAERIVTEIKERIASIEANGSKKVTRFSIIGYSLGGLLSRYVVGILQSQGFFDTVQPRNFHTIATPHIGLLRYPTFISRLFARLGPTFLSRTGEHFYGTDKWSKDGKSLLEAMSDPDSVFYRALTRFPNLTIYGNAIRDITVPYPTALIEAYDPFADHEQHGIKIELDPKYAPLIASYSKEPIPLQPETGSRFFKKGGNKKKRPALIPPFLQRRFPLNLVIYALLPIIYPVGLILAVFNFTYESFNSRRRIRILERAGKSSRHTILALMRELEREVEEAVVDFVEDGSLDPAAASVTNTVKDSDTTAVPIPVAGPSSSAALLSLASSSVSSKSQPTLLPAQERMIANLNSLPHLKKHRAYIDGIMNTHGSVVSRDVKRFEFHRQGEGVLRHLADHFVL